MGMPVWNRRDGGQLAIGMWNDGLSYVFTRTSSGVENYSFLSDRQTGVTNFAALMPFFQKMADVQNSSVLIQCAGDSITYGLYSDGSSTPSDTNQAPYAMPAQLSKFMNSRIGMTATFSINADDDRNTFVGASQVQSVGLGGFCRQITNTQTITINLPACTTIEVIYYESNGTSGTPTSGSCSYNWGGGTVTGNITYAATFDTYKKATIAVTGTAQTLVLTGTTANPVYVAQVNCYTTGGVVVGRNGRGGWTTSDFLGTGGNFSTDVAGQARVLKGFGQGSTALNIVMLGFNDCALQATAGQLTTTTLYKSNLLQIANRDTTIPLLLVSEPDGPNSDASLTEKYRDYWAAARSLATIGSNIAHMSIGDFWGNYTTANANGYNAGSSVHPSRKGYGSIANMLATVLSRADIYRTQLLTGQ
jgi:lysophospholipase L1-like esterase